MSKLPLDVRLARALGLVGEQGFAPDSEGLPVRNAPSPLSVFVPFLMARNERRKRRLSHTEDLAVKNPSTIELGADGKWHDTGISLRVGDKVSINASGRLFLSRPLEVSIGPRTCLWYRIGHNEIAKFPAERSTIVASRDGPLLLQAALPGTFASPHGEISIENPPPPLKGKLAAQLTRDSQHPEASRELPAGWQYLWRLGDASIFGECPDDGSLCCETRGDVGILQYPVDVMLEDGLRLRWDWKVDVLPSNLAEHTQPTHDYLSIAVEFDNGLDLTYMWSSHLEVDTIFQCPLPFWDKRETHWVLRVPGDGLGKWITESRDVLADYRLAIGGELPSKVVAVWLIANSLFQDGLGVCRYRKIHFQVGNGTLEVHPLPT